MENNKVSAFRNAAFTVMDKANEAINRVIVNENGEFNKESLAYNLGYNAGVLDLVKQLEADMAEATEKFDEHIKALREQIINAHNTDDDIDPDVEDYLGGND